MDRLFPRCVDRREEQGNKEITDGMRRSPALFFFATVLRIHSFQVSAAQAEVQKIHRLVLIQCGVRRQSEEGCSFVTRGQILRGQEVSVVPSSPHDPVPWFDVTVQPARIRQPLQATDHLDSEHQDRLEGKTVVCVQGYRGRFRKAGSELLLLLLLESLVKPVSGPEPHPHQLVHCRSQPCFLALARRGVDRGWEAESRRVAKLVLVDETEQLREVRPLQIESHDIDLVRELRRISLCFCRGSELWRILLCVFVDSEPQQIRKSDQPPMFQG